MPRNGGFRFARPTLQSYDERKRKRNAGRRVLALAKGSFRPQRLSVRPGFLGLGRSARSSTPAPTGGRRFCAAPRALPAPACPSPVWHLTLRWLCLTTSTSDISCPKRATVAQKVLSAAIVVLVVIGLQHIAEAAAYRNETLKETVSMALIKNVIINDVAENPDICCSAFNLFRLPQGDRALNCCEIFGHGVRRNNVSHYNSDIINRIRDNFPNRNSSSDLHNNAGRFPVVAELDFCHRPIAGSQILCIENFTIPSACCVDAIKKIVVDFDVEPCAVGGYGSVGGLFGGRSTVSRDLQLVLGFFSLPVGNLSRESELMPRLSGLNGSDLATASNLALARFVKRNSGNPQSDSRESQNYREGSDNAFVVSFEEMSKADYERRKGALENGTVFIAILTGAGAIWWWMACFKR